jgi:uncharacterized protein YheU (UPF0270 family)
LSAPPGELEEQPVPAVPLVVPHRQLSAAALRGVIEAYVLREGTDYGWREFSLEQKVAHVTAQLEEGTAQIWFDPDTNSVDIRPVRGPQ